MEARPFGVQGENARVGDRIEERIDTAGRVEIDGRVRAGHAPNLTAIHFAWDRNRMTQPVDEATTTSPDERPTRPRRPKAPGFRSADILRTAALVIAMYLLVQLIKFAHPLFLNAFGGI